AFPGEALEVGAESLPLLGTEDLPEPEEDKGDLELLPDLRKDQIAQDSLPLLDASADASAAEDAREEALEDSVAPRHLEIEDGGPGKEGELDERVEVLPELPGTLWDPEDDDALTGVEAEAGDDGARPWLADHQAAAERGELDQAIELIHALILSEPDDLEHRQRLVEYAFRKSDDPLLASAYLGLAECLVGHGEMAKARSVFRQVLSLEPGNEAARAGLLDLDQGEAPRARAEVASSEEYVDLGSLILGEDAEKTTRWTVTAEAPSGDEEADFAKMLTQFKEKVSEHLAVDDVAAHYDLGTAYMEMGLFDEAISEFQMALRASPGHLPTHEVMGRCWMQMDQPDMAVRGLRRALEAEYGIEDELIGIYYLMGLAQEDLGNKEEAVEFYEKVFSLDINFEDVTERLRALR
ncbi:tetratricopeptide repeat protein, partial [Gemmatimonadota bacterium]